MKDEVNWKVYTDQRFNDNDKAIQAALVAQEKAVAAALAASKEAVTKAEVANEKRFDGVNEFRQALSDQTNTFLPRSEYDVNHKTLQKQMDTLAKLVYVGLGIILTIQFVVLLLKK
jgi:leucyl aminopeptidase (aminopeptidase T)